MALRFVDLLRHENTATESFKSTVENQIWTINYWPTGKALLDEITKRATGRVYDTTLDVRYTRNVCAFRDDGVLYYDPSYLTSSSSLFEPTQPTVIASHKTYVYVFHELVHFYHYMLGGFKADAQEEFRTVGLYQYALEKFSENGLRKEAHLPRRPCYYWRNRPDNASQYQMERMERQNRGLPDQSLIQPGSKECQF